MRRLAILVVLVGCGDDRLAAIDAAPPDGPAVTALRVEGEATITRGADRVDCSFYLDVFDITADGDTWTVTTGGEVFRRPMPDGGVFEFSALVGGPGTLVFDGATLEARLFGDALDEDPAFWRALEVLTASETGALAYDGTWTCAPILLGDPGFPDLDLEAPGTWTLRPAPM